MQAKPVCELLAINRILRGHRYRFHRLRRRHKSQEFMARALLLVFVVGALWALFARW